MTFSTSGDTAKSDGLPAIIGGQPLRPAGPPSWPPDDPHVREALNRALADGSWGTYHGPHCEQLKYDLGELHQCEHVLLCCSGTAAIELALHGARVGSGDEVILAAYDYKPNFGNVIALGATPVLVDIDPASHTIDPEQIPNAITQQTRAIVASHLHGGIVPMSRLMEIARERDITVVEDACQMTGGRVEGRRAGMWGDLGVISFGGSKLLSAGRGGAIISNDAQLMQRIRLHAFRGNDVYPLSEIQAAVLVPQLRQLDARNGIRSERVAKLVEQLNDLPGLVPFKNDLTDCNPAWYKFGMCYEPGGFSGVPRDRFCSAVRAEGVAIDPGLRSLHRIHSARRFRSSGELTNASHADKSVVTLHHPVLLEDESAILEIIHAVKRIREHADAVACS